MTALLSVPALVPFRSHPVPCTPGSFALVGTLPYRAQPQDFMTRSHMAGETLGRMEQDLTRFGL